MHSITTHWGAGLSEEFSGWRTTIQFPGGGGGGWIFCRGRIIYFNPARRRAENLLFKNYY